MESYTSNKAAGVYEKYRPVTQQQQLFDLHGVVLDTAVYVKQRLDGLAALTPPWLRKQCSRVAAAEKQAAAEQAVLAAVAEEKVHGSMLQQFELLGKEDDTPGQECTPEELEQQALKVLGTPLDLPEDIDDLSCGNVDPARFVESSQPQQQAVQPEGGRSEGLGEGRAQLQVGLLQQGHLTAPQQQQQQQQGGAAAAQLLQQLQQHQQGAAAAAQLLQQHQDGAAAAAQLLQQHQQGAAAAVQLLQQQQQQQQQGAAAGAELLQQLQQHQQGAAAAAQQLQQHQQGGAAAAQLLQQHQQGAATAAQLLQQQQQQQQGAAAAAQLLQQQQQQGSAAAAQLLQQQQGAAAAAQLLQQQQGGAAAAQLLQPGDCGGDLLQNLRSLLQQKGFLGTDMEQHLRALAGGLGGVAAPDMPSRQQQQQQVQAAAEELLLSSPPEVQQKQVEEVQGRRRAMGQQQQPWEMLPSQQLQPSAALHPPFEYPKQDELDLTLAKPFKGQMPVTMGYQPAASRFAPAAALNPRRNASATEQQGSGYASLVKVAIEAAVGAALGAAGRGDGKQEDIEGTKKVNSSSAIRRPFPELGTFKTLTSVWKVWDEKHNGGPALRELEEGGPKWRRGYRQSWHEWKLWIDAVYETAKEGGAAAAVVVARMEVERCRKELSVPAYVKLVCSARRTKRPPKQQQIGEESDEQQAEAGLQGKQGGQQDGVGVQEQQREGEVEQRPRGGKQRRGKQQQNSESGGEETGVPEGKQKQNPKRKTQELHCVSKEGQQGRDEAAEQHQGRDGEVVEEQQPKRRQRQQRVRVVEEVEGQQPEQRQQRGRGAEEEEEQPDQRQQRGRGAEEEEEQSEQRQQRGRGAEEEEEQPEQRQQRGRGAEEEEEQPEQRQQQHHHDTRRATKPRSSLTAGRASAKAPRLPSWPAARGSGDYPTLFGVIGGPNIDRSQHSEQGEDMWGEMVAELRQSRMRR